MERERHLDEILGDYLAAADAGQAHDRRDLLAGHPDLGTELGEFFTDLDLNKRTTEAQRTQRADHRGEESGKKGFRKRKSGVGSKKRAVGRQIAF